VNKGNRGKRFRIPVWAAITVLPVALFLAAATTSAGPLRLALHGKRTTGRLERVSEHYVKNEGGSSRRPSRVTVLEIRFRDPATGADIHFEEDQFGPEVGDPVPVLYDPEFPEGARIGTFAQLWAPSLLIFGFVMLGGVLTYLAYRFSPRLTL